MKQPDTCVNMTEIRAEIDALDRQVIALLGQRFQYVQAAAKFKTSATSVKDSARFRTILEPRDRASLEVLHRIHNAHGSTPTILQASGDLPG